MIVMVLENHPYPKIIGHAPFITSLAHRCGLAAELPPQRPGQPAQLPGDDERIDPRPAPELHAEPVPHPRAEHLHPARQPPKDVAGLPGVDAGPVRAGVVGPVRGPAQPGRVLPPDRAPAVPPPRRPARPARVGRPEPGPEPQGHARLHVRDAEPVPRHARLLGGGRRRVGLGVGADDREEPGLPRRPHRASSSRSTRARTGSGTSRRSSSAPTPAPARCHTGATRTSR